jgi:hypothetical protein
MSEVLDRYRMLADDFEARVNAVTEGARDNRCKYLDPTIPPARATMRSSSL